MDVPVPITMGYAAVSGLWVFVLGFYVTLQRFRHKVFFGDGGNEAVARAVRVHGNNMEYVPIALILMALLELQGAGSGLLHGLGLAVVLGRMAHALGLGRSTGFSAGRFVGTNATISAIVVASAYGLWAMA